MLLRVLPQNIEGAHEWTLFVTFLISGSSNQLIRSRVEQKIEKHAQERWEQLSQDQRNIILNAAKEKVAKLKRSELMVYQSLLFNTYFTHVYVLFCAHLAHVCVM